MTRWIARSYLIAIAASLAVAVVSGLVLERELWTPELTGTMAHYNTALVAHGSIGVRMLAPAALAGAFGYVLVDDARFRRPALGWIGFGLYVVALALAVSAVVVPAGMPMPGETDVRSLVLRLASGGSGIVTAVHVGMALRGRALATAFVAIVACGCVLTMVGLPALTVAVGAAAVVLALAALLQGGGVAVAIYVSAALIALAGYALAGTLLEIASLDIHWHDTYVVVGIDHLYAIAVTLAMLAALHAWAEPLVRRVPHPRLATIGAAIVSAAGLGMAVAMMSTGARGMPRRYVAYEPSMTSGHRTIGIAGVLFVVGLAVIAAAWIRSAPARRESR